MILSFAARQDRRVLCNAGGLGAWLFDGTTLLMRRDRANVRLHMLADDANQVFVRFVLLRRISVAFPGSLPLQRCCGLSNPRSLGAEGR